MSSVPTFFGHYPSACACCGEDIWWAQTASGKRMPIDPPGRMLPGNVSVWRDDNHQLRSGTDKPTDRLVALTTSHFATCEYADQHRKPR